MPPSPASLSLAPELPLKFDGGDPSLDLVNTVDWTSAGLEHDRLVDYARLLEWADGSGVISRPAVARLLAIARDRPDAARSAYQHARWARWVLQRLLTSVAATHPSVDALEDFNRLLRHAGEHLQLVYTRRGRGEVEWRPVGANDLDAVLWQVAIRREAARVGCATAAGLCGAGLRLGVRRSQPERASPLV